MQYPTRKQRSQLIKETHSSLLEGHEEKVAEAVRSCLRVETSSGVKVSLTRKPFRGTRKAFVRLEEARALTLQVLLEVRCPK